MAEGPNGMDACMFTWPSVWGVDGCWVLNGFDPHQAVQL